MTPAEAELALTAYAARERRKLERMDAAAWLAGRYAAVAWHAPGRYPQRPATLKPARMSDGEMKAALLALARQREGEVPEADGEKGAIA